jgi:hypothetical protein
MSVVTAAHDLSRAVANTLVDRSVVSAAAHRWRPVVERATLTTTPAATVTPGPIRWARMARGVDQVEIGVDVAVRAAMDTDTGIDETVADTVLETTEAVADTLADVLPYPEVGQLDNLAGVASIEWLDTLVPEDMDEAKVATSVVRVFYRIARA